MLVICIILILKFWTFSNMSSGYVSDDFLKLNKCYNIGATACRASARAETFNGLQKVLQILCVPGPTTLWTFPVSDEDILMKDLKRWRKIFLRKMKKCIFGRNPKASYIMTETLIVQKVAYILASLCEGEWFSYLFSVLRKISYKLEKKMEKIQKKIFITLFAKKIQSEKMSTSLLA